MVSHYICQGISHTDIAGIFIAKWVLHITVHLYTRGKVIKTNLFQNITNLLYKYKWRYRKL